MEIKDKVVLVTGASEGIGCTPAVATWRITVATDDTSVRSQQRNVKMLGNNRS